MTQLGIVLRPTGAGNELRVKVFIFFSLSFDDDIVLVLALRQALQIIDLFHILNIDFSQQNVLDIDAQCFLLSVYLLLKEFLFHFFKLRDGFHKVNKISLLLGFDQVHISDLTLNYEHALIIFEIEPVIYLKCRHFAQFFHIRALKLGHFLNK